MLFKNSSRPTRTALTLLTVGLIGSSTAFAAVGGLFNVLVGADNNSAENPFLQPVDPALSGGGRDQTLKFGDILIGSGRQDLVLGGLGVDLLLGGQQDDVLVGGTEHFNPENRDRAFGGSGNDAFLWSPGDGSDYFNGGPGQDVVAFGLLGEINAEGELVFQVTNDQKAGDVYINPATGLPLMDMVNSPGFCEVVDGSTSSDAATELNALGLDRLVRFFIRGVADSFEAGTQTEDNGLRVTLHLVDVEFLVCTNRDGGQIEAFDLTTQPPTQIRLSDVPVDAISAIVQ